jgi:hypothetical protein
MQHDVNLNSKSRAPNGTVARALVFAAIATIISGSKLAVVNNAAVGESQPKMSDAVDVVVYASDLSESALDEWEFANDPSSPGGKMVMTPNKGDEVDPPPENDPHVIFKANVQRGVPYRCWIHMKVGTPKGKSKANRVWVQFSHAVDKSNKEILAPGTGSYLTAQGPEREGWTWVACDMNSKPSESLVVFRISGEITVRVQEGMEGVGFDQLVFSPARFLEKPPAEPIVKRSTKS